MWTTCNFDINVTVAEKGIPKTYTFGYPFRFGETVCNKTDGKLVGVSADVSSDAQFFVATCVLSVLYCIFIAAVYAVIDEFYTSKPEVPLAVSVNLIFYFCLEKNKFQFFF